VIGPFSSPSYLLPPITVFLSCLVLIWLVWRAAPARTSTRLFLGMLLSLALWCSLIFGMRISPTIQQAYLWEKATPALFHAAFVLYYHFTLEITNTKGQKAIIIIAYLSLLIVAALTPTRLILENMRTESYGYAPVLGPLGPVIGFIAIVLMIGGGFNLFKRYRISSSYEEKNRILYLITALAFPLLGAFLDGFTNLPPLAVWCNLVFCVLCAVAIIKYHLLDIPLVLRKSLVYLFVSAIIAIPYVSVLLLLNQILNPMWEPWWVHALIILLLAIVLRPLYSRAQILVDRLFYRERYDFLRELEDFSQETHDISDLNQLFSSLVKLISRALQASSVYLLLSSGSGDFVVVSSSGENTSQLTIKSGSPLLRWLESNEGVLRYRSPDITPRLKALTSKVTNELERMQVKLFIPLKTKEKALVGILILGEKLSEQPYSEEDERLVVTVASRVAVELENARLYALERSTRKELERQDEQKTEFLHSVAHELKTPLTALISASELLNTGTTTLSQRQKLIRLISDSAWSMDKKVVQLLDLAKMEVEGLEIKAESLEIGAIIEEVTYQLLPLFKNKGQSLKLEISGSLSPVKGDREKLEQVLINLLSNANKFSPTGGSITVRAQEVDDKIVVEVKDSAPAISEEEKAKVFDLYYRGEDADRRRRIPGLGLGLAICKKLIELHQGRIWVDGEPGKGNVFAFSLPTWNMDEGQSFTSPQKGDKGEGTDY